MDLIGDYMDGKICVRVYYFITNLLILLLLFARPAHRRK